VRAQEPGEAQDEAAEVVVVTAPPRATTSHVVSAEDLDIAGIETLAEALDWVAGATSRIAGQGAARFDMRGSRQRSSCVLLDGVPVNEPWGGSFDLERIPVTAVRALEVLPGPPGDPQVPGCPGGIILVHTRDPLDERGGEGRLDTGTGWMTALRASAATGADDHGWGGLGSLQATQRAHTVLPRDFQALNAEDGGERELSDARNVTLLASAAREGPRSLLHVGYHGVIDEHGSPPDCSMAPRFQRVDPLHRQQLGLRWTWFPRPDLSLAATAHGAWMRMDTARYTDVGTEVLAWQESIRAGGLGGSVTGRAQLLPWLAVTTLGAVSGEQAHTWEADTDNEQEQDARSAEWTAGGGLHLKPWATARLDAWGRAYGQGDGEPTPVGRVELAWQPWELLGLRANAARGARAPTLRERYDTTRGDPTLRPELAEQLELALIGNHSRVLAWDLAAWSKWATDVINAPSDGQSFTNNDPARYAGLESALRLEPRPWVRLRAAHAWTRVIEGTLDHVPEHQLVAAARFRLPWGLWLDSDVSWVTERSSGAVMLDPYWMQGVQAGVELGRDLWARLRVDNLWDAVSEDRALSPGPGRSFVLSLGGRWWEGSP
jgi:outer membrane receptor protein involved in Fe transport